MPFLIPALIVGGAAIVSGLIKAVAANKAAEQQKNAADAGVTKIQGAVDSAVKDQTDAFTKLEGSLKPYTDAGSSAITGLDKYQQAGADALSAQRDLAGLNGPEKQKAALEGLSSSPELAALAKQGEDALLQNAAATGGVRGGNTQGALAQIRPSLLSDLVNKQYERLGGLTSLGQSTAMGVAQLGAGAAGGVAQGALTTGQGLAGTRMSGAASIADLLAQKGAARAGAAIATGDAWSGIPDSLAKFTGTYVGAGGKF